MPNQERREVLNKVLKVGNEFYNNFKIPSITYHGKSITINNLDQYKFENLESLPIQTWSQPCHEFVDLDSRGLFHHLGDDLAFLFAASEYGDAYIVVND